MSAENKVQRLGRVEYIEPNDMFVNGGDTTVINNAIPQPYEDYAISVNLRVINGNRYDCGMTSDGGDLTQDAIEFSSDNGTISFIDGTSVNGEQGYLTTNFTDISMNDPNTNTRECLGIEHISIRYDSWYFPQVDIKFVDVRGASLMQPAEYQYYNSNAPEGRKRSVKQNSNFFKALFSFPYPLFKLSVKGFYGKELTYDLSVANSNIEFNSQTGNFEVSVNFIGYMYGMYSDLPFTFVYLAPYIDLYGKNAWEEKKNTGDFTYLTSDKDNPIGEKMYTFPELKVKVDSITEEVEKELADSDSGRTKEEAKTLQKKLSDEVSKYYPPIQTASTWWSWSKETSEGPKKGYFAIVADNSDKTNRTIFNSFFKFETALEEYNKMVEGGHFHKDCKILPTEPFEGIYKEAEALSKQRTENNENVNDSSTEAFIASKFTDADIKKMLAGRVVSLAFHNDVSKKDAPVLLFDETESDFSGTSKENYIDLINEIKRRFNDKEIRTPIKSATVEKKWTVRAFEIEDIEYRKNISNRLTGLTKEVNELSEALEKKRDEDVSKRLNFDHTVRNLFNMIFAHIDTFMTVFYNTLDRIRKKIQGDDQTRNKKTLCSGNKITVDVNENALKSNASNGGKLPPFTMFYREVTEKDSKDTKQEMVWPGRLPGGNELDEVKLVEAIINATALNKKSYEPVTAKDNIDVKQGNLVPTNYYDIISDGKNPYLDILNEKTVSDANIVNQIVQVFTLRCYYSLLNGNYLAPEGGSENVSTAPSPNSLNAAAKAKLIAQLEIGNLLRAFHLIKMGPNANVLNKVLSLPEDGSGFINKYLSESEHMFTQSADNNLQYKWIKLGGSDTENIRYFYPTGMFNPSVLKNLTVGTWAKGTGLKEDEDKFFAITKDSGTLKTGKSCYLFGNNRQLERTLGKYGSGEFVQAARLFPNYKKAPKSISDITFAKGTFAGDSNSLNNLNIGKLLNRGGNYDSLGILPVLPSYRKTNAGITSVFMDPLYYAQKTQAARAYWFLMGIPYGKDKDFFLPEKIENGDYPTLMLLREGAVYWRQNETPDDTNPFTDLGPITYEYSISGVDVDRTTTLADINKNDPAFGSTYYKEGMGHTPKNASEARMMCLVNFFYKWATGEEYNGTVTATSYTRTEIPTPSVDFQTIERYFALQGGTTVKATLDSGTGPTCAVTTEYASAFANGGLLRSVYDVGSDGKLGKVITGKIRTDVFLSKAILENNTFSLPSAEQIQRRSTETFMKLFTRFYLGFNTIIDFSTLDNPNNSCTVSRTALTEGVSAFLKKLKETLNVSSEKLRDAVGTSSTGKEDDSYERPEYVKDEATKLAVYMSLKNLYDRWLCSRRREWWVYSSYPERMVNSTIKSDFSRFYYIDEFYHDIGMKMRPNLTRFTELSSKIGGFTEKTDTFEKDPTNKLAKMESESILKMMSITAEIGGASILTLPTMLGMAKGQSQETNSVQDVFKAFPFNEAMKSDSIETSFVILYTNQKSSFLDQEDDSGMNGYKNDGFDLANSWGEIVPVPMFTDGEEDDFVVPCFGVTFAKQNQSYFKDVRLSMANHQLTEYALKNTLMISYANNKGPRETAIAGQDLYSVYSNYSYSCSVEMMGDAQIIPLMYFQLNNIPMWKGAYMITNVTHEITAGGMTTNFTGVRQARPSVPFKDSDMINTLSDALDLTPYKPDEDTGEKMPEDENSNERPLDKVKVDDISSVVFTLNRSNYSDILGLDGTYKVNGTLTIDVYYNNGDSDTFLNTAATREYTSSWEDDEPDSTRIENFVIEGRLKGWTILPPGKLDDITITDARPLEEYRNPNDSFYGFTDNKHLVVTDLRLNDNWAEFILGNTKNFSELNQSRISMGGLSPIMLLDTSGTFVEETYEESTGQSLYHEIFNFVKRVKEAKKPISLIVNQSEANFIKTKPISLFGN